jgi:NitT/TauT family transport system substrate-binding protein
VAGEGPESAAVVKNGQVDTLSQFDTQYALAENAGVKLRLIRAPAFRAFAWNGFAVIDAWLRQNARGCRAGPQLRQGDDLHYRQP